MSGAVDGVPNPAVQQQQSDELLSRVRKKRVAVNVTVTPDDTR
jgi:hypothetical protein